MGLFDLFRRPDINQGLEDFRINGGTLVDVRTPEEYRGGHIPGSVNVPLQSIQGIKKHVSDQDDTVFVYCQSGSRSSQAKAMLERLGYSHVVNIGGIYGYKGKVEY